MLTPLQWLVTLVLVTVVCGVVYAGWFTWERFEPGPDYRPSCWDERLSDYWAHLRWSRYASKTHRVFMIGDSVTWGQEVRNDETISHYLNEEAGGPVFANMAVDGLPQAAFVGLARHYSAHWDNVILQFNPYWLFDVNRDLQGNIKRFRHPRIVPQFHPRIHYNDYSFNERLSYMIENHVRIFPLVRHIIVNYFDNKSVAEWMVENPYRSPLGAITFRAADVIAEAPGKGLDWREKGYPLRDVDFVKLDDSVQWDCFMRAVDILRDKDIGVFVILGPYYEDILMPGSRERLLALLSDVSDRFEQNGIRYCMIDSAHFPDDTIADACPHMLAGGHRILAREMMKDPAFTSWLEDIGALR